MRVQYLFHSGFLVETDASYYIFDYYRGALPPLETQKPVVVFVSHAHRDHWNPALFPLLRDMGMRRVLAVLARDVPARDYPPDTDVRKVYADKSYDLPGGERLETLRSTDRGVAFLLTTPAGTIYHAGDLNDWTWDGESDGDNRQMRGNYRHEIDKLAGLALDVAFVPLDPRLGVHYADGLLYLLSKANAKRVYPMHYWEQPEVIARFLAAFPQYEGVVQYTEPVGIR